MVGRVATWVQITQQTRNTWDGLTQWILEPSKNKLSQHTPTSKILTYDKWFGKAIGLACKFDFFLEILRQISKFQIIIGGCQLDGQEIQEAI